MTHDKLLEIIDFLPLEGMHRSFQTALRAVVELHKPEIRYSDIVLCSVCYTEGQPYEIADSVNYPCPTIQAIKKELE
jgi:hypothetical protein